MTGRSLPRAAALLLAALLPLRCAHMEPPSGGPADVTPPSVAAVHPAPGAENVPLDAPVVIRFSEWIDRNSVGGQVFFSPPLPGRLRVAADGDELRVVPLSGRLRPNTTYRVTVLGGVRDLRGNPQGEPFTLRFSTGAAIADSGEVSGQVGAPEGGRGVPMVALYHAGNRAAAEALVPGDAGFRAAGTPEPWRELPAFLAAADSAGRFTFDSVTQGEYALFAFQDLNGNFTFDAGLEPAAPGPLSLSLRPRAPAQFLHLSFLDTLPLRLPEAQFLPDSVSGDAGSLVHGMVRVRFPHPPHPLLAAEPERYRIVGESGESLPVLGAGWHPEREAWLLEAPPLRAGATYRVELRAPPDFPGRPWVEASLSPPFAVASDADTVEWRLSFARPSGADALPRLVPGLLPESTYLLISNRPLNAARWRLLEGRAQVFVGDSLPVPAALERRGPVAFSIRLPRPLRPGNVVTLRLRPAPADTAVQVLAAARVQDSAGLGALRFVVPESLRGWTFWVRSTGSFPVEYRLPRGEGIVESGPLPAGFYRLEGFRDVDGDGVWNPGSLRPWIPQEPRMQAPGLVEIRAGVATDVTERLTR